MDHGEDQIWHYFYLRENFKKTKKLKSLIMDMIRTSHIDDIVESINKLIFKIPKENNEFDFKNQNPSESWAPYKVFGY